MTDRKKKGIAFLASGLVFCVVGIILMTTVQTPAWVSIGLQGLAAIGNVVGLALVLPSDV
jgi:hypothetical protein